MAPAKLAESLRLGDVTVDYVKPLSAGTAREFGVTPMTQRDLFFANAMRPYLFAYRAEKNDGSTTEKVERLKSALAKTLDLYYPIAGRFVFDSSTVGPVGPRGGRPQIVCNDAGVPFIDAYADYVLDDVLPTGKNPNVRGFDVEQVLDLYMPAEDMFGKDLKCGDGPFDRALPEGGLPTLVIQVTRFKCGGVVLAVVFTHMLMDGTSFAHFMKSWSDIAVSGETTIVPYHHRSLADDMEYLIKSEPRISSPPERRNPETASFIRRAFEVSRSVIESMKQEVQRDTNGSRYVSTIDCIATHFWYALVRLGSVAPDLSGKLVIAFEVVEGRRTSKDPPLPRYYFGNVVKPVMFPLVPPNELLAKPASSAALRVRDHIKSRNTLEAWNSPDAFQEFFKIYMFNKSTASWCTTALSSFPLYDIEFDLLGKPSFAFPAAIDNFLEGDFGRVVLYPPVPLHKDRSSATVHVEISSKQLGLLCSDPVFMSLFLDNDSHPE